MFEIAIRAKELASSNLNSLIDKASNPAKMLKLLMTELEESVIALTRDATRLERGADKYTQEAERFDAAAQNWQDKAELAMSREREDLARGALAERNAARDAAEIQREAARAAQAEAAGLRDNVRDLEAKHAETRLRLLKVMSQYSGGETAGKVTSARTKIDALMDRFAALDKRIDYAADKAGSLDHELTALADAAALDADLAALRKKASKKRE